MDAPRKPGLSYKSGFEPCLNVFALQFSSKINEDRYRVADHPFFSYYCSAADVTSLLLASVVTLLQSWTEHVVFISRRDVAWLWILVYKYN